jgi:hypothetical protein
MEDVLAVYTRAHDPDCPVVCLDETSKQLVAETRVPVPMKPGQPARSDYEYERNGTANMFMMFAPLEGWRHVILAKPPTKVSSTSTMPPSSSLSFMSAVLMAYGPSGFIGTEAHITIKLQGATFLANEHQVNDAIPIAKRLIGILEIALHGQWKDL